MTKGFDHMLELHTDIRGYDIHVRQRPNCPAEVTVQSPTNKCKISYLPEHTSSKPFVNMPDYIDYDEIDSTIESLQVAKQVCYELKKLVVDNFDVPTDLTCDTQEAKHDRLREYLAECIRKGTPPETEKIIAATDNPTFSAQEAVTRLSTLYPEKTKRYRELADTYLKARANHEALLRAPGDEYDATACRAADRVRSHAHDNLIEASVEIANLLHRHNVMSPFDELRRADNPYRDTWRERVAAIAAQMMGTTL